MWIRLRFLFLVFLFSMTGCMGQNEEELLSGQRETILLQAYQVSPDPKASKIKIRLPKPQPLVDWTQPHGNSHHVLPHIAFPASNELVRSWKASVGRGSANGRYVLLATPVVADGRVYTLDGQAVVRAFDENTGSRLWQKKIRKPKKDRFFAQGAGLSYGDGDLLITTGWGSVVSLDAQSGEKKWENSLNFPLRGSPTVTQTHVFVMGNQNQTFALSKETGDFLWSHRDLEQDVSFLRKSAPAVKGDIVVSGYSSGGVVAMRMSTGQILWRYSLEKQSFVNALESISAVSADPVIYGHQVILTSPSGSTVSLDLFSGKLNWSVNTGGDQTPWVAGNVIYLVSSHYQLLCLETKTGKILWMKDLQKWKKPDSKIGKLLWSRPTLLQGRLFLTSNYGESLYVSPYDGKTLSAFDLDNYFLFSPVVVNEKIYFMTQNAVLMVMRPKK